MGKTLIDDRYELRGPLGSGGMADVFVAHDNTLDRDVALKILKDYYASDEEFVERFKREAQSAAALSHPNIVSVFDQGRSEDGTYYIAMEYLPGGTLKDHILKRGPLAPQIATQVALQIAEALQAAHKRGIIHRDVKARNILISDSGDVKVTDFGIARAADATTTTSNLGDILGTAKYMSPEQAAGEPVGPQSDLYSLGVVLYEMLTGRVPFEVETPADVAAKHAAGEPPAHPKEVNPEVAQGMDALVMKLLSRDPQHRYASAAYLIEELGRIRDGLPSLRSSAEEATTAALGTPAASTLAAPGGTEAQGRRRLSWSLAAFVALIVLLGAVGGAVGWNLWQDRNEAGAPEGVADQGAGREPPGREETRVPDVEGLTEQEARERLAGAGFETEVRLRDSPEDAGRVLEQSVAGGKEAEEGSKILLTVGQAPEVAKVPEVVGLSYPEAENALEESGFLLGGVKEAPSDTVPAGVIMKQDPAAGTTRDTGTYVYLTTSVGPPEGSGAGGGQQSSSTGSRYDPSAEEAAVAAAVQGHYEAIGRGDFEEAYSYFGPTFRSQHEEATWIASEQSYEIQSSMIHSLTVDEVLETTATATVDVSFVDNTGTPRFLIVWGLVKEGGAWKLDEQYSAQRIG